VGREKIEVDVLLDTRGIAGSAGGSVRGQSLVHAVDLGELDTGAEDHLLHLWSGQVATGVGADVGQTVPFVHAKLSHADLDVQAVVVVFADVALGQVLAQHVVVNTFASFDLSDQTSSGFGKDTQCVAKEVLPPFVLPVVGAGGPLACSHADEDTDFPSGPFVHGGFFQHLRRRVVRAGSLIDEKALSDLDGFKSETGGRGSPTGLPNGAVKFGGRFFSRVVGTEEDG